MIIRLITLVWLVPLVLPFQAGRWYLRNGRTGAGLGLLTAVVLAVAALVAVNVIRSA